VTAATLAMFFSCKAFHLPSQGCETAGDHGFQVPYSTTLDVMVNVALGA
jgi:hypothetical protein